MRVIAQVLLASNALRERFENPISIKSFLLFGAIIAFFVALGVALSIAKNKKEEKTAQNLIPFFDDYTLETKKLERTLAVALLASAVIAIAISAYYIWEPTREAQMTTSFESRSIRRGQTLYANEATKGFNATQSLSCANCHGGYNAETGRWAEGGTAQYTLKSLKDESDPACEGDNRFRNPDCVTVSVAWQAPALNTVLYKYPILKADSRNPFKSSCSITEQRTTPSCRSQVFDILVYGRPGTPMPAWGVAGGGAKNEQSINDLVNFLGYIQLPKDEAGQPLRSAEIIKQKNKIATAQEAIDKARETVLKKGVDPKQVDIDSSVVNAKAAIAEEEKVLKAIEAKSEIEYLREAAIKQAESDVATATKTLNEEAPSAVKKAQVDYDAAKKAYESVPALMSFSNPQDYLDKLEKEQTEIQLEKKIEDAKARKAIAEIKATDAELTNVFRLKNIAQNFIESRDALATAKATLEVFAPRAMNASQARLEQLQSESDGQLLFEANCARCHTKGWSYFTPSNGRVPLPASQGSGAFGPKLQGTDLRLQFITPKEQFNFISNGSVFQSPYGSRGVGTGRMPGFNTVTGRVLTDEQIDAIVTYERDDLDGTGTNSLGLTETSSLSSPVKGEGKKK